MIPCRSLLVLLKVLIVSTASFAQTGKTVTDYLNIPGPIVFETKSYSLVETSYVPDSSSFNSYKQEYIANDDTLAKFKTMVSLTVFTGNAKMEDLADAKVSELGELKASNPIVTYETFNNRKTGEYMIDFLTSENTPDGQYIDIAERNVYRYKTITDSLGQEFVLLFAVSVRSYGDDVEKFLNDLKSKSRIDLIRDVGKFTIPEITIVKK
jgi:hypothetical protein